MEGVPVGIHIAQQFLHALLAHAAHPLGLPLRRQSLKAVERPVIGLHEVAVVAVHQGGEEGFLALVIPVERPGGDAGVLGDAPEGRALVALGQELRQRRGMDPRQGAPLVLSQSCPSSQI